MLINISLERGILNLFGRVLIVIYPILQSLSNSSLKNSYPLIDDILCLNMQMTGVSISSVLLLTSYTETTYSLVKRVLIC